MPTNTYVALDKVTVGTATASVTFSSIPATYTDLILVCNMALSTSSNPSMRFNGDTTTNYSDTWVGGSGTTAASGRQTSVNDILIGGTSTGLTPVIIQIQNYANTTTYKTCLSRGSAADGTSGQAISAWVGLWRKVPEAINSITILPGGAATISSGSTFSLYGIAAVPFAAKATGGTIAYADGYWTHTFTSSGTFTPTQALSCDYLVVAGGGAGGGNTVGGGGGAGGYRTASSYSVSATSYTVTVGAGGAGASSDTAGASGTNSSLGAISATGGGGGGRNNLPTNAGNGGSGGGAGEGSTVGTGNAGSYSPVEGYNGGAANDVSGAYGSGGGGGSSAVGASGTTLVGGNGGAGTASSITGTSVTRAGGGGGGVYSTNSIGTGGAGGGGNGGSYLGTPHDATSATINTGSGGGGAGGVGATPGFGGSGGSGVVIVRYAN